MNFTDRVIKRVEKEGWDIELLSFQPITFTCKKHTFKRAVLVRAHGRISKREWQEAYNFGKMNKCHVLYAHEVEGHEINFKRIYPRFKYSDKTE